MSDIDGVLDLVSIRIDEKLAGLTPNVQECCIFKVNSQLRKVNEKAYEPELLAIGPYHYGKDELKQMEEHKLRYLQQLVQRRNESSVERYIKAMRELEGRARRCYAEPISLTSDEFVEMLLLDGCFFIELFRKLTMTNLIGDPCDPILRLGWMAHKLWRDLVLFENQLPFFVVTKLIEMTKVPNQQDNLIYYFMLSCRSLIFTESVDESLQNIGHDLLLDLAHNIGNQVDAQNIGHLLALAHKSVTPPYVEINTGGNDVDEEEWKSIPTATELQEAGVKFKKLERGGSFFDIKFNNGVMEIPPLKIEDRSESFFRNLVAYEQYSRNNIPKYFTEYMIFMDNLINSPKDVELLRRRGIIENWLGDDEAVSTMFNKIGHNVGITNLCYDQILRDVHKHCRRRQNVWMAKLRHNYFNSPWALISFLAAAFLLLLALTQTIFTAVAYFIPRNSLPSLECSYQPGDVSIQNNKHLLGLIHKLIRPSFAKMGTIGNAALDKKEWKAIQCNLFNIKFNNGVMGIPLLKIEDQTECIFRNLIAYEQYSQKNHPQYVTDYVSFMDYLINSPKDVELLRRRGIIEKWLGDDEVVSTMFNKLGDCVGVNDLCYAEILSNLNKHCGRRQNVWMANLRHNYFNSSWALISFLAAAFLLLLTIAQTIFSILSYIISIK